MLKLLGSLLLAAAGYGIGAYRLAQRQRHLEALRQLSLLLGRIRDEIEYRALPLGEILALLQTEPGAELLRLADCTALQCYRLPESFTPQEQAALNPTFAALGQRPGPESCRMLAYYQTRCAAFVAEAEREARQAKQLYRPAGLCGGLLAALLLL